VGSGGTASSGSVNRRWAAVAVRFPFRSWGEGVAERFRREPQRGPLSTVLVAIFDVGTHGTRAPESTTS